MKASATPPPSQDLAIRQVVGFKGANVTFRQDFCMEVCHKNHTGTGSKRQ